MANAKTFLERARRWQDSFFRDRLTRRFTKVYDENAWGDDQSRSGPGSRLESESVREALEVLELVTRNYLIRSLHDIPSGDFNWLWRFLDRHPEVAYRGFDVVPALVRANRKRAPGRRFDVLNVATTVPPAADLIFCKDLLNHLTFEDIASALANMARSGSKLLLASNNFGHANAELAEDLDGHSRHLDITAAPLNFPRPVWNSGYLGLWRLADFKAR